jgi:hypothetical protein
LPPREGPQARQVAALASAAPIAGSKDDLWQNFVSFVGKEKKFLASHLEAVTAYELPPGQLKIGVAERHHFNYLQDPDNLSLLKQLAKRFFGDDVAVQITATNPESSARRTETAAAATASLEDQGDTMVKEALRIFGGSIRTVRRENS